MKLYVDMDGVLANFDEHFKQLYGQYPRELGKNPFSLISKDNKGEGFFRDLPIMPKAKNLWNEIKKYKPTILTATGTSVPTARKEKLEWVHKHLGTDIPFFAESKGRDKFKHVKNPTDLLIDDRVEAIDPWIEAGGTGILYHEDRFAAIIKRIHNHMKNL